MNCLLFKSARHVLILTMLMTFSLPAWAEIDSD